MITIADIASMIVALATTGSLLYISRQVNVTRQQAKGQFLLALDDQFEKFNGMTFRMVSEKDFTPEGKDWAQIFGLMSVFERINIMVEDQILDVPLVDRLHGFRLMSLIANDAIFHRVQSAGVEWQDFIDLCYAIADHRHSTRTSEANKAFRARVYQLSKTTQSKNPFGFSE